MLRLRRVNRLCSRTISGTAYRFRHGSTLCSPTVEKILCRSPFRSGHMSAICARLSQKEVGVKRVETLVSTLLPRRGARHVPAVRRRRIPPLRCSEKLPARKGRTRLRQFAYPAQRVLKKTSARQGRTRFRSSRAPAIRCRNGLCPPLEHKKRNPYGFLFEIALPYQDALRTPGIWPL